MKSLFISMGILVFVLAIYLLYHYQNDNKKNQIIRYKKETFLPQKLNVSNNKKSVDLNLELWIDYNDIDYIPPYLLQQRSQNIIPDVPEIIHDRDSQNVHDSFIQNYTSRKYNESNENNNSNKSQNIQQDIIDFAPITQKQNIQDILNKISLRNSTLTKFNNDHEMDILQTTWDNSNNIVKAQIINELLDCRDGNELYCPTGVATRIVNANFIEEPEKMAKTKELFHQEMMNTAANLRTELESDESFNNLTPEIQTTQFKNDLLERYNVHYSGVITEDEILKMTRDWIDYI